jgi:hypothetical protein
MNKTTGKFFMSLIIFLTFQMYVYSQIYPLARKVTIHIHKQPIETVLMSISHSADVIFSYNSDILPLDSVVSVNYTNTEIQKILNQLFQNRYSYKTTGKYIIIQNKKTLPSDNSQYRADVRGKIIDSETGEALPNTSVYSISGKQEILSDSSGLFKLTVDPGKEDLFIAVNNEHFEDTLLLIPVKNSDSLLIMLKPKVILDSLQQVLKRFDSGKSIEKLAIASLFLSKDIIAHAHNIDYFTQRPAQISFLPFAGTNYRLSGSVSNNFSMNILSGYSYGVNGCEIGGLLNINRNFVKGFQAGGLGNITGGKTEGIQTAGLMNHNAGSVSGVQLSGFYNMTLDSLKGIQVSGFMNFCREHSEGIQLTGFSNISVGAFSGTQISGFSNISSKHFRGLQLAGFSNISPGEIRGVQISGFLNFADKVRGSQIGIVNIADSVSGISFGIFNFIRHGLHQFSFQVSETGCSSLRLSLGTHSFYSLFGLHLLPVDGSLVPGYEYGFGTYLFHKSRLNVNIDAGMSYFNSFTYTGSNNFLLPKFSTDINIRILRNFSLFTGGSYSLCIYEKTGNNPVLIPENYFFKSHSHESNGKYSLRGWFGIQAGIKLAF